MVIFSGKRGISTIIGAVLGISLAIAMAAIVYISLSYSVKSPFVEQSCPDIQIAISDYKCDNGIFNLTIQNKGSFSVDGYILKINNGTKDYSLLEKDSAFQYNFYKLGSGESVLKSFDFTNYTSIIKIEVEAIKGLAESGKPILCANSVSKQAIENCCKATTCAGKECGSWSDNCGGTLNCGPETISCTKLFGSCNVPGTKTCSNGAYGDCIATDPRPLNCAGKNCGSDGCGGTCGTCTGGLTCVSGVCKLVCTASCNSCTYANICSTTGTQTCTRTDCTTYSQSCGARSTDGINCGVDSFCTNGVCTCVPETDSQFCSRLGKNCGSVTAVNNCGILKTVNCGSCSGICQNGVCCTPATCASLGKQCGSWSDNCGGLVTCSECGSGLMCDSSGSCFNPVFIYSANALPQNSNPAWQKIVYTACTSESVSGGILSVDCSNGGYQKYQISTNIPDTANGHEIIIRAKTISGNSVILTMNLPNAGFIYLYADKIGVSSGAYTAYSMDTTNAFHTYRIVRKDNNIKIYVDDIANPVINVNTPFTLNDDAPYFFFQPIPGNVQIDYAMIKPVGYYSYEANEMPADTAPTWSISQSSSGRTTLIDDGILTNYLWNTPSVCTYCYGYANYDLNNADIPGASPGWKLEAKMGSSSSSYIGAPGAISLNVYDGTYYSYATVNPDGRITIGNSCTYTGTAGLAGSTPIIRLVRSGSRLIAYSVSGSTLTTIFDNTCTTTNTAAKSVKITNTASPSGYTITTRLDYLRWHPL